MINLFQKENTRKKEKKKKQKKRKALLAKKKGRGMILSNYRHILLRS